MSSNVTNEFKRYAESYANVQYLGFSLETAPSPAFTVCLNDYKTAADAWLAVLNQVPDAMNKRIQYKIYTQRRKGMPCAGVAVWWLD